MAEHILVLFKLSSWVVYGLFVQPVFTMNKILYFLSEKGKKRNFTDQNCIVKNPVL